MKLVVCLVVAMVLTAAAAFPCQADDLKNNPDLNERWELYKVTKRFISTTTQRVKPLENCCLAEKVRQELQHPGNRGQKTRSLGSCREDDRPTQRGIQRRQTEILHDRKQAG